MALISLQEISLAFGGPLIFDKLSLYVEPGQRVALLGRNGVGKTTLMKVMAGQVEVDAGEVVFQKGIKITHLPQEVPRDIEGTVFDVVFAGLGERAKLLSDYHHITRRLHTEQTSALMDELGRLQEELNHTDGWDLNNEVEFVLAQMKLDGESPFETLSSGQKRRALLAKALVIKPEVLLLDEPTNHLDIDTINWLEEFLKTYPGTLFFVTHDRMFMRHLATQIIELDRGRTYSWMRDYDTFLKQKQAALDIEEVQRANFDKKLAEEEIWIRKGVKARRTRNEGRVKALECMREEKRAQRDQIGKARIAAQEAEISGRQVIKAEHLGFSYGDNCIIRDFSIQIMRGDKIGVIGANGSGKTTLLRILTGTLSADQGTIKLGTKLEIAYYDQLREQLDYEKTVIENVIESGGDTVVINGKPRHAIGYLQDFLFTPERARTPVKILSGGERNRLFLARLFTRPSNFLIMDEPTNDLDLETQELLEELLTEYSGTLILVSHDRAFLNNVIASTIVFEGKGEVYSYPGGYDDWLAQRPGAAPQKKTVTKLISTPQPSEPFKPRKLSFKEKQELERLPGKIQELETEQEELSLILADVSLYKSNPNKIAECQVRAIVVMDELLKTYERWEYLEDR